MTGEEFEYVKPSRTRTFEKPDREVRVKDRVPKHTPYKRERDNLKTRVIKGELQDDDSV